MKALGLADRELDGMSRQEGQEVVRRILQGPIVPQVVVSIRNLDTVAKSVAHQSLSRFHIWQQAGGKGVKASMGIAETTMLLEQQIAEVWQQLLGIERVGMEDDFFRLGGESLSALQILNRVQELCGVELSLREFFDAPTIVGLTAKIRAALEAGGQPDMKIVPLPRQARRLRGASV